jgi:hypothetical protein
MRATWPGRITGLGRGYQRDWVRICRRAGRSLLSAPFSALVRADGRRGADFLLMHWRPGWLLEAISQQRSRAVPPSQRAGFNRQGKR